MINKFNIVIVIHDGFGFYAKPDDWCTLDAFEMKRNFQNLNLLEQGYINFTNCVSPAVSTIMSIESILNGLYAAKSHKIHWREWPWWDKAGSLTLGDFMENKGYQVNGFSYLLNSENWMPSIKCYRPDLYLDFPSEKKDTHSYEAVINAFEHYFDHEFDNKKPQCLFVHSVYIYNFWDKLNYILKKNGLKKENTIFVVTADHYFSESFGRLVNLLQQEGLSSTHHTDLTENNTRVPLYIRYPNCKPTKIDSLVSGYDITPTIIDLLGIKKDWKSSLDGQSLLPLLTSKNNEERHVRSDNVYPFQIGEKQGRIISVRNNKFKLVIRPDPPSCYVNYRLNMGWNLIVKNEELYNLKKDPHEKINLLDIQLNKKLFYHYKNLKKFYTKTTNEILNFHKENLLQNSRNVKLPKRIKFPVMVVQNTHNEIHQILADILEVKIDMLMKNEVNNKKPNLIRFRFDLVGNENNFKKVQDSIKSLKIQSIIFTSHANSSWYGKVYNQDIYFDNSSRIINYLKLKRIKIRAFSFGLDLNSYEIFPSLQIFLNLFLSIKNKIINLLLLLRKVKNFLVKSKATRQDYTSKIITTKQRDYN